MQTFELSNENIKIRFLNYGARIIDWQVKLDNGWRPIVLGYPTPEDYIDDPFYLGAVCGPYANRIAKGHVNNSAVDIQLSRNDGANHLHGGFEGLDKQYWQLLEQTQTSVTFEHEHTDGKDGYPGPMLFKAKYTLTNKGLTLTISCQTESNSILSPTGHSYFNLNGVESPGSGLDQYLQSDADWSTPLNEHNLPIGTEQRVKDSDFYLQQAQLLSALPQFEKLDNNFVFESGKHCSVLTDAQQQLTLIVSSDYPAVQLYSGSFLNKPFVANQGVCIEPHFGADAPNRVGGVEGTIYAGQAWQKTINYQLEFHSN